jgi:hypothetical protein
MQDQSCLSVCLSVRTSVRPSVRLSVCLPACLLKNITAALKVSADTNWFFFSEPNHDYNQPNVIICDRPQRLAVALQLQLTNESTALGELQRKLCFAVREEERRVARQTDAFQRIHASALAQQDTPADQR